MVSYEPGAVEAIQSCRTIFLEHAATAELVAPIVWCCGQTKDNPQWVGRELFAILIGAFPYGKTCVEWMMHHRHLAIRKSAVLSLGRSGDQAWEDELIVRGLHDRSQDVRFAATVAIHRCSRPHLLPELRRAASREAQTWLREKMQMFADTGEHGYHIHPTDADRVCITIATTHEGSFTSWFTDRSTLEEGGIDKAIERHFRPRATWPVPRPLPPAAATTSPPWTQFHRRPMGYQFMNRFVGPDVVQVLKERHERAAT